MLESENEDMLIEEQRRENRRNKFLFYYFFFFCNANLNMRHEQDETAFIKTNKTDIAIAEI